MSRHPLDRYNSGRFGSSVMGGRLGRCYDALVDNTPRLLWPVTVFPLALLWIAVGTVRLLLVPRSLEDDK